MPGGLLLGRGCAGAGLAALVLVGAVLLLPAFAQQLPPAAALRFRQAIEYLRAQQYPLAEQALNHLLREFPENADIHEALAIVLDLRGNVQEANTHFQHAVRLNPRSAQVRLNLGANYFRLGKLAAAETEFLEALKLRPNDPTIRFNLGTLYLRQQKFQEALPHLEHAQQRQPEIFENSYQLGLCYFFLRQHEKASKLLEALESHASQRAEYYFLLGLNSKALGRDAAAENAFRQALGRIPSSPEVYATLGPMFIQLGLYAEAITVFERAHELNPDSYEAAYYLVVAYHAAGQPEKARAIAQSALKRWERADLHHLLGEVNERLGSYVEAVNHFQRAVELEPSERNVFDLGYEFLVHWSWDAAFAVFQKGLELHPKSEWLWLGSATAYYAQGDYTRAIEAFLEATAAAPDNVIAYRLLVATYPLARGYSEAVQRRLRQFQKEHPDNPWANYCYALALWQTPDRRPSQAELTEATRLLQRAVALAPDMPEAHYQLGVVLSEQGQWPEAVHNLEAAVRSKADYVEAHYRLALAYQRIGNSEQARAMLAQYRKLKNEMDSALDRRASQTTKFIYSLKR